METKSLPNTILECQSFGCELKKSLNKFIHSFILHMYVCCVCLGSNVHIYVGAFVCECITTYVHVCLRGSGLDIWSLQDHPPPCIPKQVLFLDSGLVVWAGFASHLFGIVFMSASSSLRIQVGHHNSLPPFTCVLEIKTQVLTLVISLLKLLEELFKRLFYIQVKIYNE